MGVALGFGESGSSGSSWIWFGQRIYLGEGAGVKWKQSAPLSAYPIHLLWPAVTPTHWLPGHRGRQEKWTRGFTSLSATVSWTQATDKRPLIGFVPYARPGSWLSRTDSFLFSHTDQSFGQMGLVGGRLKSQKGQSCVGDRAFSEFPTMMFRSSWGPKASPHTRPDENAPGFAGNYSWLCHILSKRQSNVSVKKKKKKK